MTRNPKPHILIDTDAIVYDTQKRVIIRVWKDKAQNQVKELDRSTCALESQIEIAAHKTSHGTERTIHVGLWQKYADKMKVTQSSKQEPVKIWLERNQRLFSNCSYLFKCLCKETYEQYKKVEAPLKLEVWTACAINFNWGAMKSHIDEHDYHHGFCFVIPFGDFTGGKVYFEGLNITVSMCSGMVVAFKSYELKHQVMPYEGSRYSIVLFTHQNCFFPAKLSYFFCSVSSSQSMIISKQVLSQQEDL
jgi:hypothetical protein